MVKCLNLIFRNTVLLICSLGITIPASAIQGAPTFKPIPVDENDNRVGEQPVRKREFKQSTSVVSPQTTTYAPVKDPTTGREIPKALPVEDEIPKALPVEDDEVPKAVPMQRNPDGTLTPGLPTPTQPMPAPLVPISTNMGESSLNLSPTSSATIKSMAPIPEIKREKTEEEKQREKEEESMNALLFTATSVSVIGLGMAGMVLWQNRENYFEKLAQARRALGVLNLRRAKGEDVTSVVREIDRQLHIAESEFRKSFNEYKAKEAELTLDLERTSAQLDLLWGRPVDDKQRQVTLAIEFLRKKFGASGGMGQRMINALQKVAGTYYVPDPTDLDHPANKPDQELRNQLSQIDREINELQKAVIDAREALELRQDKIASDFIETQAPNHWEQDRLAKEINDLQNGVHLSDESKTLWADITSKKFALHNSSGNTALSDVINQTEKDLERHTAIEIATRKRRLAKLKEDDVKLETRTEEDMEKARQEYEKTRFEVDDLLRGSSTPAEIKARKEARAEYKKIEEQFKADSLRLQAKLLEAQTVSSRIAATAGGNETLKTDVVDEFRMQFSDLIADRDAALALLREDLHSKDGLLNHRRSTAAALLDLRTQNHALEEALGKQILELKKQLETVQKLKDIGEPRMIVEETQTTEQKLKEALDLSPKLSTRHSDTSAHDERPLKTLLDRQADLNRLRTALLSPAFAKTHNNIDKLRVDLEQAKEKLSLADKSEVVKANDAKLAKLHADVAEAVSEIKASEEIINKTPVHRWLIDSDYKLAKKAHYRATEKYRFALEALDEFNLRTNNLTTESLKANLEKLQKRINVHDKHIAQAQAYLAKLSEVTNTPLPAAAPEPRVRKGVLGAICNRLMERADSPKAQ